jgi:hypothetical protein
MKKIGYSSYTHDTFNSEKKRAAAGIVGNDPEALSRVQYR